MIDLNAIPKNYRDAVETLAAWHGDADVAVYAALDPRERMVRLVEVSDSFGDHDDLRPIAMGATSDFPYPSQVLLFSQADWERVSRGDKPLPEGWPVHQLKLLTHHG